jgi:ketosteroid isomerase-like protein
MNLMPNEPARIKSAPVSAFIGAANASDLEGVVAAFADDALVNDQLLEYWGKSAIRAWAAQEIVGCRLTLAVVKVVEHYGHHIVTAHVDGDFDKRGLPDPLVLTLYFADDGKKVIQLIILRNLTDT